MLLWRRGTQSICCDSLSPDVIQQYIDRFAPLDEGMARRDALGLTLWSRSLLWERSALVRSKYFREFALPHDLQDSVGLSLDIEGARAHVRVALLYGGRPLPDDRVPLMLRRLGLILPVLRTGLGIRLRYERWIGAIPSMLDRVGERLILYSLAGRELHRNLTMQRTLEQDPEGDRILAGVEAVALGGRGGPAGCWRTPAPPGARRPPRWPPRPRPAR
jgi:hypothetical protein